MRRIALLTGCIEIGVVLYLAGAIVNAVQTYQAFTPSRLYSSWTLQWIGGAVIIGPQVIYFREPGANGASSKENKKSSTGSKESKKDISEHTKEQNKSMDIEFSTVGTHEQI